MTSPFAAATTLTPLERSEFEGSYGAVIDSIWTIGPKVHGGTMLATCAAAAKAQLGDEGVQPLAVSVSYLSAPDPGEVHLTAVLRKRGKQVSHVDVEMTQGGRAAVRAVVTLGRPDTDTPRHTVESSLASMPAAPPPETDAIGGEHPMASIVHLAQGCEMRIDPTSAHFLTGQQGEPEVRMWVRPRPGDENDVDTAALFALMTGDICAPVTMNRGMFGWAPTVQLTTYLRKQPAPGWLRVAASSTVIGGTWFEEDHLVLDETGDVVVQSRQLAMVPR
ncbi:thioesterase family protein [Rhodococcus sp. RS1C4]|uniref:thioesterase family protein n=1 Tax=Nocardiaceae TaxID=85025 RepID=UPI00035E9B21|nr:MULTISPECIES: thioesterase family protein [Rhodococcus]OZC48369.1 thioesterase family protein [Rhodococcus sp. 06-621-2]OZC51826.1 thioesterase family protein [Rhodococcus sp. RS1C4]OZC86930.1 thioesterase family protein [Rhodococcus sp. 06-418-1B]OZD15372.1 thioesterase family protein [Rhodococcus sp. 06-156-4C]OZD19539.1 thioesterase family protein [Rhodococcus sp. 06-156-4a]